jgi:SAM-dependent methyltransferase
MFSCLEDVQGEGHTPASLWKDLVCPSCACSLLPANASSSTLVCFACSEKFPIVNGILRVPPKTTSGLSSSSNSVADRNQTLQLKTATSFGFEWTHFSEMYPEWENNFRDYMFPRTEEFFRGKKVLDAGCGIGRHAYYAAHYGAEVWAVDISDAVEVAAKNNQAKGVRVIQADLNHLPFRMESFDLVYSIGVLHHLPDPEGAFRYLLKFVKPGGEFRMFLYWAPEHQPLKGLLLKAVSALRLFTVRMPHRLLYPLSYVAAFLVWTCFVWPYRAFSRIPLVSKIADQLPLRQYSRYPFRTCINDQFDRLSAPLERRYSRTQVEQVLRSAGLEELNVFPNFGWVASGRKPASTVIAA